MKKIVIEINYEEEKDLFFHLSIIRTQIKTYLKNKSKNIEDEQYLDLTQESFGANHIIKFENS